MATVYRAKDLRHRRDVAIKVLHPHVASMIGPHRFLREIEIAARLNHPHILPLHDSGEADGYLYYVMPLVAGGSVRNRMAREGQLPIDEAVGIARQVAAALEFAHTRGVIHRDMKPENILLYEGEAMVADFGIALAAETDVRLTETGLTLGTPAYMSPEQSLGDEPVDRRSDVYSLACVLFEMLAGEPPFSGTTARSVLTKRLTDPAPSVRRLRPAIPSVVNQALAAALAAVPSDRPATAAEFSERLVRPANGADRPSSVAVLPFVDMNADPENEFFADGITEDVIAHLSKVRALHVISRTSVMPFKGGNLSVGEIGARLGVSALLEGSVRRVGQRVRIVAQLIDARTDRHLWAETYDRQLSDIFAIQSEVALHIADALRATLSPEERSRIAAKPTRNVEAYQLYLKGRHCLVRYTEEGLRQAIAFFDRAIELDKDYALAWTGLATAHFELARGQGGGAGRPSEEYRRAKAAAARALDLDDNLAEAHCVQGALLYSSEFDWAGAEAEFERAIEIDPGNADAFDMYGQMLSAIGRSEDAIRAVKRARELDPLAHRSDLVTELVRAGRYDEAIESARELMEFDPRDPRAWALQGWALMLGGRVGEGLPFLERAAALDPGNTMFLAQLGEAFGMAGRMAEARAMRDRLEAMAEARYVSPYHLAYVYTGLGETEKAIDLLTEACEERGGAIQGIAGSFLFIGLRSHPRFKALLQRMNLPIRPD